jgi:predicted oxidoreductase
MRIAALDKKAAARLIRTALDGGANFFDHADIYSDGECEVRFAEALTEAGAARGDVLIQSKCGIGDDLYDFSRAHILESVDGSLRRLNTEYLDVLLLHRPDALTEPEEVAEAFDMLKRSGKVRLFGVSNHNPGQIRLLKKHVKQPLHVNQLQLSITHADMIAAGMHVNTRDNAGINRDGGILDYCRLHDITVQPWSPFQYGYFEGVFLGSPKFPELNAAIDKIALKYSASATAIALAWLLRHPAAMQPVTGTTNPDRLRDCLNATAITLSREDWYTLHLAAGYTLP